MDDFEVIYGIVAEDIANTIKSLVDPKRIVTL